MAGDGKRIQSAEIKTIVRPARNFVLAYNRLLPNSNNSMPVVSLSGLFTNSTMASSRVQLQSSRYKTLEFAFMACRAGLLIDLKVNE
jgi:hypothetical protein